MLISNKAPIPLVERQWIIDFLENQIFLWNDLILQNQPKLWEISGIQSWIYRNGTHKKYRSPDDPGRDHLDASVEFFGIAAGIKAYPENEITKNADYIIGMNDDSREPEYFDEDIAYVKKTDHIETGDISIFQKEKNIYI